ncbi:MAG: hypothetical protein WBV98_04705, partial [Candidatus Sulfotelmatobacter sp.]
QPTPRGAPFYNAIATSISGGQRKPQVSIHTWLSALHAAPIQQARFSKGVKMQAGLESKTNPKGSIQSVLLGMVNNNKPCAVCFEAQFGKN